MDGVAAPYFTQPFDDSAGGEVGLVVEDLLDDKACNATAVAHDFETYAGEETVSKTSCRFGVFLENAVFSAREYGCIVMLIPNAIFRTMRAAARISLLPNQT